MERRAAYPTDTQHIVNLSGYVWAARQLGAVRRSRILDLSCGTGYGADYLGTCADRIVAIDCVPEVVTMSRSNYPRSNVQFLAMDGCALGFRDDSFDCIVSQDTIEHISDDARFVAELTRVLRVRGTLIILLPMGKARGSCRSIPIIFENIPPKSSRNCSRPTFQRFGGMDVVKAIGSRQQNGPWIMSVRWTSSEYVPVCRVRFVIGSAAWSVDCTEVPPWETLSLPTLSTPKGLLTTRI